MKREFVTKNPKETEKLGSVLAKEIVSKSEIHLPENSRARSRGSKVGGISDLLTVGQALVLALEGELGAGKTTFVKGFAKALRIKEKISSPTFVLIKNYKLRTINYKLLFHIDAYRLKDHQDLISLGVKEILNDPQNIILIEWSDRVKKILPKKYLKIHIDHISENERKIVII